MRTWADCYARYPEETKTYILCHPLIRQPGGGFVYFEGMDTCTCKERTKEIRVGKKSNARARGYKKLLRVRRGGGHSHRVEGNPSVPPRAKSTRTRTHGPQEPPRTQAQAQAQAQAQSHTHTQVRTLRAHCSPGFIIWSAHRCLGSVCLRGRLAAFGAASSLLLEPRWESNTNQAKCRVDRVAIGLGCNSWRWCG